MMGKRINEFYDINKLPAEEGMIVFPISMSRISNESQNARRYMEYVHFINPSKVLKTSEHSRFGVHFIYGDFLYLYSEDKGKILKKRFMELVASHHNSFQKLLTKELYLIQHAFTYSVWNQLYLSIPRFVQDLEKLRKIYRKDKKFQEYVRYDFDKLKDKNKKLDEKQLMFFLEEHLIFYFITKGLMKFENEFIQGKEKWILVGYPGKPLKAHIYLHQQNFFKLKNPQNKYENSWYDLEEKRLYDFLRVDLETIKL